jgi:hypothetical protein
MRRSALALLIVLFGLRCASFSAGTDGLVQYESINRHTVLLRFTSSPPGAEAFIECGRHRDNVVTPDTVRLPVHTVCAVTFAKPGYEDAVTEFDPAEFAHGSVFSEPACGDPGVWCDDADSLGQILFGSLFIGTSGLIARAFDPIRNGRGEIGAVLLPMEDHGSESAPPGR